MKSIFVNLKRFDVPRNKGGVCPCGNPGNWIRKVIQDSIDLGIGLLQDIHVVYFIPEALIIPAQEALASYPENRRGRLEIGCQSVFRDNVLPGKNFGAFTSNLPAASAYQIGCRWSIIGHSEERRDKQEVIGFYQPDWNLNQSTREKCSSAVDRIINREVLSAMQQGMDVLLCIGETAEERGGGDFEEQQVRIKKVLSDQLLRGLEGVTKFLPDRTVVIGYEPIWAIGPGKTPPGKDYIQFVSALMKDIVKTQFGFDIPVVYGGGLKEENAAMISGINTIDGGLVALTRFSGEIGFYVNELKSIMDQYSA